MSYKEYDDKLLMLLLETTNSSQTRKYIESILLERFSKLRDVGSLYKIIKSRGSKTSDVLWTAIAMVLSTDKYMVDVTLIDEIFESMPMNDLAIISNYSSSEELKEKARTICYKKQEEYEKEIGIYDKGKLFKEKISLLRRRR